MAKFYAVKKGRKEGIYLTWDECKQQVDGYSNATFKSFKSKEEALEYLNNTKVEDIKEDGLVAYVDGSFNIKSNEYGAGCVLIDGQKVIKQLAIKGNNEDYASMKNVAGEILGSKKAIEYGVNHDYKDIYIYYDYAGIEKWATKEWKANKEGTKEYSQYIDDYQSKINIHFIKVLAHSGDAYNELADSLAKKAVGISE